MQPDTHPEGLLTPPPGVRGEGRVGPAERLRLRRDFERLRRVGRAGGDDVVRVIVGPNGLAWSRFASGVSRHYGKAVARNRLRRLYREAFRLEKGSIPPGYDVLITPPRGRGEPDLATLRRSLVRSITRVVQQLERHRDRRRSAGRS